MRSQTLPLHGLQLSRNVLRMIRRPRATAAQSGPCHSSSETDRPPEGGQPSAGADHNYGLGCILRQPKVRILVYVHWNPVSHLKTVQISLESVAAAVQSALMMRVCLEHSSRAHCHYSPSRALQIGCVSARRGRLHLRAHRAEAGQSSCTPTSQWHPCLDNKGMTSSVYLTIGRTEEGAGLIMHTQQRSSRRDPCVLACPALVLHRSATTTCCIHHWH